MEPITVTIALHWDTDIVDKPIPAPYTTKVSQGTFLIDIMKKAANEDVDGPFNKYSTTYYGNVGDFVIAMDGVEQVLHSDDFSLSAFFLGEDIEGGGGGGGRGVLIQFHARIFRKIHASRII